MRKTLLAATLLLATLSLNAQKGKWTVYDTQTSDICGNNVSALATDAIRADLLEQKGYKVQILEFIEESATPKNLLIRAVRTGKEKNGFKNQLMTELGLSQTLANQLKTEN